MTLVQIRECRVVLRNVHGYSANSGTGEVVTQHLGAGVEEEALELCDDVVMASHEDSAGWQ